MWGKHVKCKIMLCKSLHPIFQVFWIGPLVGAFVAAILYEYIFSAGATFNRTKTFLMRSKNQPSKEVANNEDDKIEVIQIEEKKSKEEEDQVNKQTQLNGH